MATPEQGKKIIARKQAMLLTTLIGAAGVAIGINWDKIVASLGPTVLEIGKTVGVAYNEAIRLGLQQKKALEDMVVEVGPKDVTQ